MTLDDYRNHLLRGLTQQQQAFEAMCNAIELEHYHEAWTKAKALQASANWTYIEAEMTAKECQRLHAPLFEKGVAK